MNTAKEMADATVAAFRTMVEREVETLLNELSDLRKHIAEIEPGRDGRDGPQGERGLDAIAIQIHPSIDDTRSYPKNSYASHRGGVWRALSTTDGMIGWECLWEGVHEITEKRIGEREIERKTVLSSGREIIEQHTFAVPIYRGVWKQGTFEAGDMVTWAGSMFFATRKTESKPEIDDSWKLCVKRGRDGKDAR